MRDGKRKTILVAEVDAVELTLRIAEAAIGLKRPAGRSAALCLDEMRAESPETVASFDRIAKVAAAYLAECIENGSQPS